MFDLFYWCPKVYELNEKWWTSLETGLPIDRDEGEMHALMASELSEAMEGERKNLNDDKLPQFKMAGVEMVDFVIRAIDYATRRGIKLEDRYLGIQRHLNDEIRYHAHRSFVVSAEKWKSAIINEGRVNRSALIWDLHVRLAHVFTASQGSYDKTDGFSMLIALARVYCDLYGYPFDEMFQAKFEYNVHRVDHKHESRSLANGKKF